MIFFALIDVYATNSEREKMRQKLLKLEYNINLRLTNWSIDAIRPPRSMEGSLKGEASCKH